MVNRTLALASALPFKDVATLTANTVAYSLGDRVTTQDGFAYDCVASGGDIVDAVGNEWVRTETSCDAAVSDLDTQARLSRHMIGHAGALTGGWINAALSSTSTGVSVSWENINIIQGQSNSGRNIADFTKADLLSGRGLYYDSTETYSAGSGYTVIEGDMSSIGNDSVTGGYILLLGNVNGRLLGYLAPQVSNILEYGHDDGHIVITGATDTLYIHKKGANKHSNRYIRWTYQLSDNAAINSAVWRVSLVDEVERTGLWSFSSVRTLVGTAEELEFAVKESGANAGEANLGFVGGLGHGNHTKIDASFFADGEEITPSGSIKKICRDVEIYQKSQLWYYDYPSHSFDQNEKLGLLWQNWHFSSDVATLDQTVKWEKAIVTAPCFMGMLPFARDEGSDFISGEARRTPLFESEDISTSGGSLGEIDAENRITLLGTLNITGQMNIASITGDTNNTASSVALQSSKNKVYTYAHRGASTVVDDTIRVVAEYKIDTGN